MDNWVLVTAQLLRNGNEIMFIPSMTTTKRSFAHKFVRYTGDILYLAFSWYIK